MSRPKLELVTLRKEYGNGDVVAVDDINMRIEPGETVALLGPSGCGKSTTLNMIVGLETPTSGDIQIDGKSVVGVPAGKRNVGLVFQDYAVFTSMSVRENLAFGLKVRGRPKGEVDRAVAETAELLGLADKLKAQPRELGGSELQRVAIGRTLVTRPDILLLDEPLSNLEAEARLAMRKELRRLQSEVGLTIIYVTHDQVEALSLADRIAVMNYGRILQLEDSTRICERPAHTFVAGFLGSPPMNLLDGVLQGPDLNPCFTRRELRLALPPAAGEIPHGACTMGVRPEDIRLAPAGQGQLEGTVELVELRGPEAELTVLAGGERLKVVVPAHQDYPAVGGTTGLLLDAKDLAFFVDGRRTDISFNTGVQQ